MFDDDIWPVVIMLVVGILIGGYFGIDYGQKFKVERYCKWKYEKHVDVDTCKEKPDYWDKEKSTNNLDLAPKVPQKSGSSSQ